MSTYSTAILELVLTPRIDTDVDIDREAITDVANDDDLNLAEVVELEPRLAAQLFWMSTITRSGP